MILGFIFNRRKKREELLEEREASLDKSIQKSGQVQQATLDVQKSVMEVAWKNHSLAENLTALVQENERTKNILLDRENKIKEKTDELEERVKNVRKEEINIEARKSEVRRNEQLTNDQQAKLDAETKKVVERENEAAKIKSEAEHEKEKYQTLFDELEVDKASIKALEEEAKRKNKSADEKLTSANSIFEKAKVIDEEIKAKEAKFEEHRETIEKSLRDKIDEYDRRLADLDAVKGIVDNIKFDNSDEGREAKIVVKETIRQAKKALDDTKRKFDELDEKYASGTFKGFSTPLDEIEAKYTELKSFYEQVKNHFSTTEALPTSVSKWLEKIEDSIIDADKSIKSWEFSEAYRSIMIGYTTCKNYELLLTILNEYGGKASDENDVQDDDNFIDFYQVLEVDPEASEQEIKKQFKKLMLKYHPDKAPEGCQEEYHAKAVSLNQAYEILSDPEKRKAFDEKRNARKQK